MEPKCLTPECNGATAAYRGLCGPCHQSASRLIRIGQTTWKELEELGICNAPGKRGGDGAVGRKGGIFLANFKAKKAGAEPVAKAAASDPVWVAS